MWLQPGQITGDCNILGSVFGTTDVLRLQKKRQLQTGMWLIANLVAV
jgi:hypothetical protein